ncbi:hypothetical protein HZ326_15933 [Fusarium oxysporum f. sp. albedinis]|nr:hypothetical protein HZ326_15933 [Fusarium oxysporum f. sp. albedinis]
MRGAVDANNSVRARNAHSTKIIQGWERRTNQVMKRLLFAYTSSSITVFLLDESACLEDVLHVRLKTQYLLILVNRPRPVFVRPCKSLECGRHATYVAKAMRGRRGNQIYSPCGSSVFSSQKVHGLPTYNLTTNTR